MFGRGWVVAAAGAVVAVVLCIVLSVRGPASGRAPIQRAGAPSGSEGAGAVPEGGGGLRVAVRVIPAGGLAPWVLEVRDSAGALHDEKGTSGRECVLEALPPGRTLITLRAPGFVGETCRLEVEQGREVTAALTLCQFGCVSGTVRCEGVPVPGALVQLTIPADGALYLMDVLPEDRGAGVARSVESDGDGRYRFDRVPPARALSLVAAGFDHAPVRVEPVEVKPGEETTADFVLTAGAHLAGRVVDSRGAPSKGATVNVLQRLDKRGGLVTWSDEARARTDEDGRFVTPALSGPAVRMLKAWIIADGVQQVIQYETLPPDRGTMDVGTLAPHPGTVQFELEGAVADAPGIFTVAVNGDPPGVGQTVILAGVSFDRDGRIRMAGLPIGEGSYSVVSADSSALSDGKFRTTGHDMIVKIPALKKREERPRPAERLIVDVAETTDPALLVLIADGSFVMWRQIGEGSREPVVEWVSPGTYTLLVCAGDRYGQKEITQIGGQDMKVSILPDRIGRSVSLLVLDEGKPVPGASVRVRGFCKDSRGLRAPWASAGSDGRVLLRGLPPDVTVLTITAYVEGGDLGRSYTIDVGGGRDQATVDLAKAQAD